MPYIPNFSFDKFYNIFFKEEQHMSKQPIVLDHPLIQHKLSILRREETDTKTFRELHEETGCTLIIISHQERIISQADEVLLIAAGKLEKRGKPEEIIDSIDTVFDKPCLT